MRCEIPRNKTNISHWVNVHDGGIYASVDEWSGPSTPYLIKPDRTIYQINSGQTFEPWQKAAIKSEFFAKGEAPCKNNLKPAIREWLDSRSYLH